MYESLIRIGDEFEFRSHWYFDVKNPKVWYRICRLRARRKREVLFEPLDPLRAASLQLSLRGSILCNTGGCQSAIIGLPMRGRLVFNEWQLLFFRR